MILHDEDRWLEKYINNPPPVATPEELEKAGLEVRAAEARACILRLPEYLQRPFRDLLSAVRAKPLLAAARDWDPAKAGNLVLLGERDEGKSTAAALVCRRLLRRGVTHGGAAWALARELQWFGATMLEKAVQGHPFGKGICRELQLAISASLLVIDDLGWEKDPRNLAPVFVQRWETQRPTIVTSGLTMKQLFGAAPDPGDPPSVHPGYGEAVIKRLVKPQGRPSTIVSCFPKRDAARAAKQDQTRRETTPRPHFQDSSQPG